MIAPLLKVFLASVPCILCKCMNSGFEFGAKSLGSVQTLVRLITAIYILSRLVMNTDHFRDLQTRSPLCDPRRPIRSPRPLSVSVPGACVSSFLRLVRAAVPSSRQVAVLHFKLHYSSVVVMGSPSTYSPDTSFAWSPTFTEGHGSRIVVLIFLASWPSLNRRKK